MVKANETPALYGLRIGKLVVTVKGTSPLLVNRFPETAIDAIEAAQTGSARTKKAPRNPAAEFHNTRYLDHNGRDCLPAVAFKESMARAVSYIDGMPMMAPERELTRLALELGIEYPEDERLPRVGVRR